MVKPECLCGRLTLGTLVGGRDSDPSEDSWLPLSAGAIGSTTTGDLQPGNRLRFTVQWHDPFKTLTKMSSGKDHEWLRLLFIAVCSTLFTSQCL